MAGEHPQVQQVLRPPLQEEIELYGSLIMEGLKIEVAAPNVTHCFYRGLNFYFNELNLLRFRYRYGDLRDNVFNTTQLLQNVSNHLWVCTDAVENYIIFSARRLGEFGDLTTWLTSFF